MAVRPDDVLKPPIAVVDELEKFFDEYLLSNKGKYEHQVVIEIPTSLKTIQYPLHLTIQQRAELKNRYRRVGWDAEFKDYEADSHDPREHSYTALVLTRRDREHLSYFGDDDTV